MLFDRYDFKRFARAVHKVSPKMNGKRIRQLYSGYHYPELGLYLRIEREYHGSDWFERDRPAEGGSDD